MTLVAASTATAATPYPADCHNFKCVNKYLNAQHATDVQQHKQIHQLVLFAGAVVDAFNCFGEEPTTVTNGTFTLTASGQTPDFWALTDTCNTSPAAPTRAPHVVPHLRDLFESMIR